MDRRKFLISSGQLTTLAMLASTLPAHKLLASESKKLFFNISLAQYSFHRQLYAGKLSTLDFPVKAKKLFDIDAVEYVNIFFPDKAKDKKFLGDLKQRTKDNGVQNLLIMIDAEGDLCDLDNTLRTQAVENHYKWVEAAQYLGCHTLRVNILGKGTSEEVKKVAVDSLGKLSKFSQDYNINIVVENHGGYSSNGAWLADLIKTVAMPNCGSLPDFGNFGDYDRYRGVEELLPYAKGVSAKSYTFDENGNEITTDFKRMLKLIKASKFNGHIGIEFEGEMDEDKGVMATKQLLQRLGAELS